jgi:serine/threonine-protein kinase RsbW
VHTVAEHMARGIGLDEDAWHWTGVAIRECVINAIKHGNRNDDSKRVFVRFETATPTAFPAHDCRARSGTGFDPNSVADPLAPENVLKSSGRGIFLIKTFMDDVQLERAPEAAWKSA